jgi:chitinase
VTEQFTVNYGTSNGTAAAGLDYTQNSGTLTFAPGDREKTVRVNLVDDNTVEPNETFFVDLSGVSSTAVALRTGRATGTIVNEESTQISISDMRALENAGTFRFTVSLSRPSASTVSVRVATANGTAKSGKTGDYTAISGTLSFAPGVVSQTVSVTVRNDTTVEPDETFFVNLSSATGATIADAQGLGTILNDDGGAGGAGGAGGPSRFLAGGSPDSLSANDWQDLIEGFGRRRGQRR